MCGGTERVSSVLPIQSVARYQLSQGQEATTRDRDDRADRSQCINFKGKSLSSALGGELLGRLPLPAILVSPVLTHVPRSTWKPKSRKSIIEIHLTSKTGDLGLVLLIL